MASELVTGPASEPVTLDEAKAHLRVDGDDEDDYITSLIVAARQAAEAYTRRALITQTWRHTGDRFTGTVTLPHQPVQSVASVAIDGEALPGYAYETDTSTGRVKALAAYAADDIGGVAITYTAGYGDAADVPMQIRQAILLTVGHMHENRESQEMPGYAKRLLDPYRVMLI
jgi:uncharacterized phiE125 gp8 family phage protein